MEKHRNADGTYNGVGVLSDLTGIDQGEITSIAEQVIANNRTLNGCPYHNFVPDGENKTLTRQQYRCTNCGGTVNASMYRWHEIGRRAKP